MKGAVKPGVVITGISGNLGRALTRLLHGRERILGIDRRPFPGRPPDVEVHQLDLRKNKVEDLFRRGRIKAVIHMGILHDPRMSAAEHHSFNVVGTTRILEHCARYGVEKVVVLSSANVYGPSPENSNFITEDAPLMAASRFAGVRDLIEVDMLANAYFWRHPSTQTVVLRPVHVVGPAIKNAPSNYLRLRRPMALAGFDPLVQLIHVEDAARALVEALRPEARGVYNVVGPGVMPLSAIFRELGQKPVRVPHPLARPLLSRLFRWRLAHFPAEELDHVQFPCIVDGGRWERDVGFRPHHGLRDTVRCVLGDAA